MLRRSGADPGEVGGGGVGGLVGQARRSPFDPPLLHEYAAF